LDDLLLAWVSADIQAGLAAAIEDLR
jgi:hypothetical protein